MNIKVQFDNQHFTSLTENRNNLLFYIYWEHNSVCYPSDNWLDFGYIILGWWVTNIIKLQEGADEGKFSFMDGPYSIGIKLYREIGIVELSPEKIDIVWKVSFVEVIQKILQAVNNVYKESLKIKPLEKEQKILRKYSAILEKILLEIQDR